MVDYLELAGRQVKALEMCDYGTGLKGMDSKANISGPNRCWEQIRLLFLRETSLCLWISFGQKLHKRPNLPL